MKTYYCVATTIYDKPLRVVCHPVASITADEKPKNAFRSDRDADRYLDYFDTKEEALEFVEQSKKA